MNLIVQLLTGIAWPVVVLWIAYLFRAELRNLIGRVSRFKYKDLEFESGLEKAETSIAVIEATRSLPEPNALVEGRLEQLRDLMRVSTRAAVMEAWIMIEEAAAKSGFITGAQTPRTNVMSFITYLVHQGRLPSESVTLAGKLRELRNQAAHYFDFSLPAFELSTKDADRYLVLASKVASLILDADERSG